MLQILCIVRLNVCLILCEECVELRFDLLEADLLHCSAYENQQKADFEAWVESIKDILDEAAAGNLLLMIETKMQKVTIGVVDGKVCLDIEEGLNLAMAGFTAKDYVFSDDGKMITETDAHGNVKTTVFVSDTQIEEEYHFTSGNRYKKTTTFEGNKISERIEQING